VLPDTIAPTPNPMSFAVLPAALGTTSISMTATLAVDNSGVEYLFTNITNGTNSGWQVDPVYEDTGLDAATTYSFTVQARDTSSNQNTTAASAAASATTNVLPDTIAPTPNPMSFAVLPAATGTTSISMTATTAADPNGVEYYFINKTIFGHDSGWQDSVNYVDDGLDPATTYTYTVEARDKSSNSNATLPSSELSATTASPGSTTDVTILDDWAVGNTFAVSPGTDRLVLIFVSAEKNGGGPMDIGSVFLGNQQLVEHFDFTVGSSTAYHNIHWVGYLRETQIALLDSSAISVNYDNPPSNPFDQPKIHHASYTYVDQTTPFADWGSNTSSNASSLQLSSPLNVSTGNQVVAFNVLGQHYNPGLSTVGYTEKTQVIGATNGHASATYVRSVTTSVPENPTFTSATSTRMAVSAIVIQ
jgi:hypothetical protein